MSNDAKVVVTITDEGIDVVLKNWEGVNNVMIERIHYAIVKKAQIFRSQKLGALHAAKMKEDADKVANAEAAKAGTDEGESNKFLEEIENVLA